MSNQTPPALDQFRMVLASTVILAWMLLSAADVVRADFTLDWEWHAIVGVIIAGVYPDGARLLIDAVRAVVQFWRRNGGGNGSGSS